MRLFFAVLLPEEVREAVARVQQELRATIGDEGVRWVKPEQFHYTLKFLGETPAARLPGCIAAANQVAAQFAAIPFSLAGIGVFPQRRSPQILWVGAEKGVPVLTRLAESLDSALSQYGFALETRRFNPHLTLARAKTRPGEEAIAGAIALPLNEKNTVDKIGTFLVQYYILMQSELHPGGPIYTPLETFALTAPQPPSS